MAYDLGTGQMVVFSGEMGAGPPQVADTWIWDGSNWSQVSPATSPSARQGATMAYDAATRQLILFGGETGTNSGLLNDTWTWDGTNWTQLTPGTSPPARYDASMAYDPANGTVMLFGGFGAVDNSDDLNDTWIWDGSTWSQAAPAASPPVRTNAGLAYDPANGGLVLFGGTGPAPFGQAAPPSAFLNDTWTWNGTNWTQQNPAASPPARTGADLAYDGATGQDILFGGTGSDGSSLNDTWAWDGSAWTPVTTSASPPPRGSAVMAYDGATGQVVLFSGWNGFEQPDTWNLGVAAPVVTGVSPASGPLAGGTSVTITGSGFTGATAVKFGSAAASSFTVNSDASITAAAPAAVGVGPVDVTVTTPSGTSATRSADQYAYTYPFAGYLSPVDNPPVVNQVNGGRAIPMRFSLGGNYGLTVIASGYPTATQVSCSSGAPVDAGTLTEAAGNSGLQYNSGTYTYVWKTSKSWAGTCQQFDMRLADGTDHVAVFQFT